MALGPGDEGVGGGSPPRPSGLTEGLLLRLQAVTLHEAQLRRELGAEGKNRKEVAGGVCGGGRRERGRSLLLSLWKRRNLARVTALALEGWASFSTREDHRKCKQHLPNVQGPPTPRPFPAVTLGNSVCARSQPQGAEGWSQRKLLLVKSKLLPCLALPYPVWGHRQTRTRGR